MIYKKKLVYLNENISSLIKDDELSEEAIIYILNLILTIVKYIIDLV